MAPSPPPEQRRYPADPRERALQLHREGRLGGSAYGKLGGRPKNIRASQLVAEAARKNAAGIIKALKAGIAEGQSAAIRTRAAESWLSIEHREHELQLKEHVVDTRDVDNMSRDELLSAVARTLTTCRVAPLIQHQLEARADQPPPAP
jgi:hypothetical protein